MPSGAKKRKAAKKKKEKEANIHSSTSNNPQGHDDWKSQDEKGSDGGEVSSPAHQDYHNNHHPFNEGSEELEEGDPSAVGSVVAVDKSMEKVPSGVGDSQKVGLQDDGVVKIERNLKSEEGYESKSISIEYVEFAKESNDGDSRSSSSSSSSSDDESRAIEKKQNEDAKNAVSEMSPIIDSVNPVVPVSEETLSVVENAPIENSLVSDLIKLEHSAEKLSSGAVDTVTGFSPEKNEDKVFPILDESAKASSSEAEPVSKVYESEELPPSSAHVAHTNNGTECIKDSEIPEYSENEPLVTSATVQRTSLLSCCGIFDVFTGSRR